MKFCDILDHMMSHTWPVLPSMTRRVTTPFPALPSKMLMPLSVLLPKSMPVMATVSTTRRPSEASKAFTWWKEKKGVVSNTACGLSPAQTDPESGDFKKMSALLPGHNSEATFCHRQLYIQRCPAIYMRSTKSKQCSAALHFSSVHCNLPNAVCITGI